MNSSRFELRKEKFLREQSHLLYLKNKGMSNLEIAGRLIPEMLMLLKAGVQARYPDASTSEIDQKLREIAEFDMKIKKLHKMRPNE